MKRLAYIVLAYALYKLAQYVLAPDIKLEMKLPKG